MMGRPRHLVLRSHATYYTYHVCAVNSLTSVSQVKGTRWMGIEEIEGDKRSTSHLEQEERTFICCRAGWRIPREVPTGMKPSYRTARGEGGDSYCPDVPVRRKMVA